LDGEIDANWCESFSSIMDDSKKLSLANNETIHLKPNMRVIFEVPNLRMVTPATVSRLGIIQASDLKGKYWRLHQRVWRKSRILGLTTNKELEDCFENVLPEILSFCQKNLKS
jgi:hypothetical protein